MLKKKITVEDVMEMQTESRGMTWDLAEIIGWLCMNDVPMSDPLIRVGISIGVLTEDAVEGYRKLEIEAQQKNEQMQKLIVVLKNSATKPARTGY